MKKYLSMIALALASVMMFSSCSKDDDPVKPEEPTPEEEKANFEVELNAEISGAMIKALELTIEYIDFGKDKSEVVVLNKDFSGANLTFNQTFKTNDESKKFGIRLSARTTKMDTYKDEPAPWLAAYTVVGKVNGKAKTIDFIYEEPKSDTQTLFSYNIDWPHRVANGINNTYMGMRYIVVDKEEGIAKFE